MPKFKGTKTVEQIAKKHDVSVDFIKKQLDFGIKIEHEHTNQNKTARTIALQHLDEFPDYYSHLQSLENTAKTDNKLNRLENRVLRNACNIISERVNPLKDPNTQLKKSSGAAALTPDAAKKLGPIAIKLQKAKASKVDLPKVTRLKESIRLPNKMGNLYNVSLNWRGKYIEVNVFFPQLRMPKKNEVQFEVRKIYPDARVITYIPADRYTSNTFIYVNEEVVDEASKRLAFVKMHHGTSESSANKIKKTGFKTSDVYTSTSKETAKAFGNRKGENTKVISFRVPKKDVNTPGKVMKTDGQSGTDKWGRKHYSTVMNPEYAEKHITKKREGVIDGPKIPKKYRDGLPANSRFRRRTKTKLKEALKKVGSKLSFTRLFRGTTKPRAELAKAGNTSMSDKGSLGSGHYVTHSQKKAKQYSKINSKQRNEPEATVTYRVPSKRIQRVREIPKANKLSDKPRELPKGKKVIVNKTSGHSVFPDSKDAQKYMIKNPQPIIRKPKSKF